MRRRIRSAFLGLSVMLLAFFPAAVTLLQAGGPGGAPPIVDRASEAEARRARRVPDASQRAAAERLRQRLPLLTVRWSPSHGGPSFITAGGALRRAARGEEADAVRGFLVDECELFRTCSGRARLVQREVRRQEPDGTVRVFLGQVVAGRPLFGAGIGAIFDRRGNLAGLSANLVPDLRPGPSPRLSDEALVDLAFDSVGASREDRSVRVSSSAVAYALDGLARPAQRIWLRGEGDLDYLVVVDAADGSLLARSHLVVSAQGKVFRYAPNDLGDASSGSPPIQPAMVSFTGDPAASPLGWVTDDPNGPEVTSGNNISPASYEGWKSGGFETRVPTSEGADFLYDWSRDYPGCTGQQGLQAKIINCHRVHSDPELAATNLFYHANHAHDVLYHLGFDQTWGNFQGDDPIEMLSTASGAGMQCNASFAVVPDGVPGSIQIGFFGHFCIDPDARDVSLPFDRGQIRISDGSLEPDLIYHEYGHGLSTRIVGVDAMSFGIPAGALGEGWSDFLAIHLVNDPNAPSGYPRDPNLPYPLADYLIEGGGRRHPYSVDETVNPLTFDDLCETDCEVHDDGEIWANILWKVRFNLIQAHGFAAGKLRMGLLLVDSMKNLSGAGPPDFLTARDALLLADAMRYQGVNCTRIWTAFTERGLGPLADYLDPLKTIPLSDSGPLEDSDGDGIVNICETGGGGGGSCGGSGCHTIEPKP